mgnify:CR=1 FL=1
MIIVCVYPPLLIIISSLIIILFCSSPIALIIKSWYDFNLFLFYVIINLFVIVDVLVLLRKCSFVIVIACIGVIKYMIVIVYAFIVKG